MSNDGALPQFRSQLANNIFIRQPMEAIAPDSLLPKLLRQCKPLRHFRHSAVKRRIKAGYLGQVRKMRRYSLNHLQMAGQVQGRKRNQLLQPGLQFSINELWRYELWAAMHNAMSCRRQLFNALFLQRAKHRLDGGCMIWKFAALIGEHLIAGA